MARFGTNFTGKNSPKKESSSQPTFPFHVAEPAADKKEELSPRESSQEAPAGEAPKITKSEDKDAEIDDSLLAGGIRSLKAEIDESAMASPYGDEGRPKSILSSQNTEAMTAKKSYVSPVSEEFEEVLDEPVENEEEELVSHNKMVFFGILFAFLYAAFLGIGVHYTNVQDGVPQRITMADRRNATFLTELEPYVTYIQDQHGIIVDSSDSYTGGTMSADELSETMKQAKSALSSKKKELVDLTAPQDYEGLKSKVIELYSIQMTYCDNVAGYLSNQSERNLELTKESNKNYEEKAKDFFEMYNNIE